MRAPDNQGSFLNRISNRRNQVVSMDLNHEQELQQLHFFHKHISDLIPPPSSAAAETLFSVAWFRKLLHTYLCCEADFKALLDPTQFTKPPLDRLVPDLLDRAVKALDICNAITHGIDLIRNWQSLAQIVVSALNQRPIGEGQVRRAKRALHTLLTSMNKDRAAAGKLWSASKQIHAMSSNLVAPRGGEQAGLGLPVYMMSTVMVFVMWALVAAIPCQEGAGLATHLPVPRQLGWAQAMIGLQDRIGEEWKKKEKEKKGSCCGMLEEVQRMEKVCKSLVEFADSIEFPVVVVEGDGEVAVLVGELAEICGKMEEGLVPLQQQVREVFHRTVKSRQEILDVLDQIGRTTLVSC